MHACTYVCTHTHAHAHTHARTHTHAQNHCMVRISTFKCMKFWACKQIIRDFRIGHECCNSAVALYARCPRHERIVRAFHTKGPILIIRRCFELHVDDHRASIAGCIYMYIYIYIVYTNIYICTYKYVCLYANICIYVYM